MLHYHRCSSCDEEVVCSCADKRSTDRETGKPRKILCFWCKDLEAMLEKFFGASELERVN